MLRPLYDVLIVGAGVSGLACARALRSAWPAARVAVLDARDRVGGRTLSVPYQDDATDLGGQWVGPAQPRVLQLIAELGLHKTEQLWFNGQSPPSQSCGTVAARPSPRSSHPPPCDTPDSSRAAPPLPPPAQQPLPTAGSAAASGGASFSSGSGGEEMSGAELGELERLVQRVDAMSSSVLGPPWHQCPHADEWDRLSVADFLHSQPRSAAVMREMMLFVRTVLAVEPQELSLLYFLFYVQAAGGMAQLGDGPGGAQTWRVRGGAQQLSVRMAQELLAPPLHGTTALGGDGGGGGGDGGGGSGTEIHLSTAVLSISQRGHQAGAGSADLHTGGGCGASWVVCTSSGTSFSARHVVLALPAPLWGRIAFDPPLPDPHQRLARGMFMGAAVKTIAVYERAFWEDTRPTAGAVDAGGHGVVSNGRLEELGPVANLFPSTVAGQPALVGLVTAGAAKRFQLLDDAARRSAVLRQYAAHFRTAAALDCTAFLSKGWGAAEEPFSGGCFAGLMPPGLATDCGDAVRAPVLGSLHFAGCETATKWVGYIEGAIEAGQRACGEVVAAQVVLERGYALCTTVANRAGPVQAKL